MSIKRIYLTFLFLRMISLRMMVHRPYGLMRGVNSQSNLAAEAAALSSALVNL